MQIDETIQPDRIIKELYAFIAYDPQTGLEGIVSIGLGAEHWAAVMSSREMSERMKTEIKELARQCGKTIRLCKFSNKEVLEEFHG